MYRVVKEKTHLDTQVSNPATNIVSPIYEEIGDPATSFTYTQNSLYGGVELLSGEQNLEQDSITPAALDLLVSDAPMSGDVYQMNLCSAYGTNNGH